MTPGGGSDAEEPLAARKRSLRQALLERRRVVSEPARREAAVRVAKAFVAEPRVRAARHVGIYAATPDELPTRPTFEALRAQRAEVLFPRIVGERLAFAPVAHWEELAPGLLGVLAPPDQRAARALGPQDVVLVPGVAFDEQGGRLGRGGGHYDRTFEAAEAPWLVGAAFACQIVPRVPRHSRDRRMDAIVTERGLRPVSGVAPRS